MSSHPGYFAYFKKHFSIKGLEIGADAYIEKPFSPHHLQVQISNLLTSRNKIKEYFANCPLVHTKGMAHTKADANFLAELNDAINQNIKNTELDVVQGAEIMKPTNIVPEKRDF